MTAALRGVAATIALGRALGAVLEPGDLIALDGDLGTGKTTLVRGLAAGVGADPDGVASPTFVLAHVYRGGRIPLGHLDVYRLGRGADLLPLGLDDLLEEGAVAVEWAEWALLDAPPAARIRLTVTSDLARSASISDDSAERLRHAFDAAVAT